MNELEVVKKIEDIYHSDIYLDTIEYLSEYGIKNIDELKEWIKEREYDDNVAYEVLIEDFSDINFDSCYIKNYSTKSLDVYELATVVFSDKDEAIFYNCEIDYPVE